MEINSETATKKYAEVQKYLSDNPEFCKALIQEQNEFLKFLHGDVSGNCRLCEKNFAMKNAWIERKVNLKDVRIQNMDKDSYISVNRFTFENEPKEINDIFIDLDLHVNEIAEEKVLNLISRIKELVEEKLIPKYSAFIFTGRGVALHYKYKNPIPYINDEERCLHDYLYEQIFNILKNLLQDCCDIDTTVKDFSRVCRIPGTYNLKGGAFARIIDITDKQFTLEEMYNFLNLDQATAYEAMSQRRKREKSSKSKSQKANQLTIVDVAELVENLSTQEPILDAKTFNVLQDRLRFMKQFLEYRNWVDGDHRQMMLFHLWNVLVQLKSEQDAFTELLEINNSFLEPLEMERIAAEVINISHYNQFGEFQIYSFSNQFFIDTFEIDEKTIEELGIKTTTALKEEKCVKKQKKAACKEMVIALINEGLCANEIKEKVESCGYSIGLSSIYRIRKKIGCNSFTEISAERDLEMKEDFLALLLQGNNAFIDGPAGCGKSYLISEFLEQESRNVVVLAYTGIAAENVNGMTISSFFGLKREVYAPDAKITESTYKKLQNVDVLILDEIGNVRLDYFHYIKRVIDVASKKYKKTIQLIVLGDFLQLPPVLTESDAKELSTFWDLTPLQLKYPFAFLTRCWDDCNFIRLKLRKNCRISDSLFKEALMKLRYADASCIDYFNQYVDSSKDFSEDYLHLCCTNAKRMEINNAIMKKYESEWIKFSAQPIGNDSDYVNLTEYDVTLYKGMRIMLTRNTTEYKNGIIGTVLAIYTNNIIVEKDNGVKISVKREKIERNNNVSYKQFPIEPAYAITIHKSQGLTLSKVVLHSERTFQENQIYVAISRVSSPKNFFLSSPLVGTDIKNNRKILDMMHNVNYKKNYGVMKETIEESLEMER